MAKNKIAFEKDEKKSIMIAIIVSIVVILAVVLAFIAIRRYQRKPADQNPDESVVLETEVSATVTEGNAIVTNQEELNQALADETAEAVLIESEETQTMVIPSGDYSRITLLVDAPYTEITNYGVFGSITLQQIASNTWTESVSGNTIIVDAPACHVIVPSGINVSSMESVQANSSLAVELQGTLALLSVEAESSIVSVQVDGELSKTMVYNSTNLTLSGSTKNTVPVELGYGSDGTVLTSSIPVNVNSFAQATVEFKEGAEGSGLTIADAAAGVALTNNTTEEVVVTKADGKEEKISAGASFTKEGETAEVADSESNAGSGASSSSSNKSSNRTSGSTGGTTSGTGSASSTGSSTTGSSTGTTYTKEQVEGMINAAVSEVNAQTQSKIDAAISGTISKEDAQNLINQAVLDEQKAAEQEKQEAVEEAVENVLSKPTIIKFVDEAYVYAGVQGELPKAADLSLPKEVYGFANTGEIYSIPVREWQNADNYSESVEAGAYRFTAILTESTEYYVTAGVEAHATVNVRPTSGGAFVTYKDADYRQKISVTEYRAADYSNVQQTYPEAYYLIENKSDVDVIYTALDFYYYDSRGNIVQCDRWNGIYIQPGKSWITYRTKPCVEYSYYVVEVSNYTGRNEKVDSFAQVQLADASSIAVYKMTEQNISECTVMILYLAADQKTAYGMESFTTGGINYATINELSQDMPLTLNLHVPNGADVFSSIIVSKGGYE